MGREFQIIKDKKCSSFLWGKPCPHCHSIEEKQYPHVFEKTWINPVVVIFNENRDISNGICIACLTEAIEESKKEDKAIKEKEERLVREKLEVDFKEKYSKFLGKVVRIIPLCDWVGKDKKIGRLVRIDEATKEYPFLSALIINPECAEYPYYFEWGVRFHAEDVELEVLHD